MRSINHAIVGSRRPMQSASSLYVIVRLFEGRCNTVHSCTLVILCGVSFRSTESARRFASRQAMNAIQSSSKTYHQTCHFPLISIDSVQSRLVSDRTTVRSGEWFLRLNGYFVSIVTGQRFRLDRVRDRSLRTPPIRFFPFPKGLAPTLQATYG